MEKLGATLEELEPLWRILDVPATAAPTLVLSASHDGVAVLDTTSRIGLTLSNIDFFSLNLRVSTLRLARIEVNLGRYAIDFVVVGGALESRPFLRPGVHLIRMR